MPCFPTVSQALTTPQEALAGRFVEAVALSLSIEIARTKQRGGLIS